MNFFKMPPQLKTTQDMDAGAFLSICIFDHGSRQRWLSGTCCKIILQSKADPCLKARNYGRTPVPHWA